MKCFAIKSGNEYIDDTPTAIKYSYYYGVCLNIVDDVYEAKHYKNKSTPKIWIKKTLPKLIIEYKNIIKNYQEQLKVNKSGYFVNNLKNKKDKIKGYINWVNNAKVVELDIEKPNFSSELKLRFNKYYNENHSSNMKLNKVSNNRYICKSCGVVLKNIPFYEVDISSPIRICVTCLYIRAEAIKEAFESMPKDFRENFVNELLLGSL